MVIKNQWKKEEMFHKKFFTHLQMFCWLHNQMKSYKNEKKKLFVVFKSHETYE